MPRRITPQTVALWRERIQRHRGSDLSVEAFCRQEGVSTTSLYNWRKKLSAEQASSDPCGGRGGTFAPVAVIPSAAGMSVVLPGGARIEIGAGQLDLARAVVGELMHAGVAKPC